MDVYMNTLCGYIKDEDKLVTYKWLSNELEVDVNVAKKILDEYWNKYKNDGVVATILLIGYLKNGEMRVELVKESNLTDATDKYEKILSQHIYSLQKTLSDIELLTGIGKSDVKYATISCEKNALFTDDELFARRWGTTVAFNTPQETRKPPVDKALEAKKSNGIAKFLKESEDDKELAVDDSKNKKVEKLEEKKISPPKNKTSPKKGGTNSKKPVQSQKAGFTNLFGKVTVANQKKSPPQKVDSKVDMSIDNSKCKNINENVDIMNNSVENPTIEPKIDSPKEEKSESNESLKIIKKSTSVEKKVVVTEKTEVKSSDKNRKKNRGTKRERSQESKVDLKKRKRIVVASDSSEDSAASDDEIVFDSPPREQIIEKVKSPSPPAIKTISGKRKIRKQVDKTFMDEDGYLVTKKEYVYESCSEDDETVKIPEPKKPVELPVKTMKKPNKQTTLMNFFKKA